MSARRIADASLHSDRRRHCVLLTNIFRQNHYDLLSKDCHI